LTDKTFNYDFLIVQKFVVRRKKYVEIF